MKTVFSKYHVAYITFIIGFCCAFSFSVSAQNQQLSDSLEVVYENKSFNPNNELKLLKTLAEEETNTDKKLSFSQLLIEKATKLDSIYYLFSGYLQKGNALRLKSDHTNALENYFKAAEIVETNKLSGWGQINIAIADVYSIMGDQANATGYYKKAIDILEQEGDSINIASAQLNLGDEYFNENKLDSALYYFEKSRIIFQALHSDIGLAYNLGNEGLVRAKKGEKEKAEADLNEAIMVLEKLGDYYPICVYLNAISEIYLEKEEYSLALNYAQQSLQLAKTYQLKEQIGDANLRLSWIYEKLGNIDASFDHYKKHIIYKDSINTIKSIQEIANVRTSFEVAQKQIEVDLLNQQQRTQKIVVIATSIALFLILIIAIGLFKRNQFINKTNKIIAEEKKLSDNLLLNILPEKTAAELKEFGKVKAQKFESVSVLFTDFSKFTYYSEHLTPEQVVKSVDYYFSKFDRIIEKYQLEKIKTIGDSYMCAAGLPFPTENHAEKIVMAAIEIIEFVNETKNKQVEDITKFEIRLGINSGPVVAGVVGSKKFSYDIWGDTVNVASRIESSSEVGQINVSETTYELIKHKFPCTYRGTIDVKNRGSLKMYYVNFEKMKESQ